MTCATVTSGAGGLAALVAASEWPQPDSRLETMPKARAESVRTSLKYRM
jgi:hypothetical protein